MVSACFFGLVAGTAAFLITHDEYSRHFPDRKRVLRSAFAAGCVAFLFFLTMGLLLYPLLMKIVVTDSYTP